MHIPNEIIEQVKDATDIVDLIGSYVKLIKKGSSNFFGLCPFHEESTPSFSVNPRRQLFNCFGCGKKGSVYSFLIEQEQITFPEAVKMLAKRASIEIPTTDTPEDLSKVSKLKEINKFAAKLYYKELWDESKICEGRSYLAKRQFLLNDYGFLKNHDYKKQKEVLKSFKLGYAPTLKYSPPDWLYQQLKQKFDEEIINLSGLVHRDTHNDLYHNMIIFPIIDERGNILSLSGRYLKEEETTKKYLNITKTLIYKKNNVFWGLNSAKKNIKKEKTAIVVEGYFDVLRLNLLGYKNVIATMGTEISERQVKILLRFADTVILIRDADEGGQKSIKRICIQILDNGMEARLVFLPEGDPDEFFLRQPMCVEDFLNNSVSFIDHWIYKIQEDKISSPVKQAKKLRQIISQLNGMKDELLKSLLIDEIAKKLEIKRSLISPDETIIHNMNEEQKLEQRIKEIRQELRTNNDGKIEELLTEHLELIRKLKNL